MQHKVETTDQKAYGTMASADPTIVGKLWSSDEDKDEDTVTFADLGVRREAEIVETYFGKRRLLSSITIKEWAFVIFAVVSILGAAGLTIQRLVSLPKDSPDFTFGLVLLVTIFFCLFYVLNGIFSERLYELLIFVVGTLFMMIYCIVNYAETANTGAMYNNNCTDFTPTEKNIKLARLILVLVAGPINIGLGLYIAREYYLSRNLIFRTVGANVELQDLCSRIFFTESLFKIDLHLEITLVILILKSGADNLTVFEIVVLSIGLFYAFFWFFLGLVSMHFENKPLVYLLLALSWCEPAYIIYRLVDVRFITTDAKCNNLIPAAIIMAGITGFLIRVAVCGFIIYVYRNFGRGMREKAYGTGKKAVTTQSDLAEERS